MGYETTKSGIFLSALIIWQLLQGFVTFRTCPESFKQLPTGCTDNGTPPCTGCYLFSVDDKTWSIAEYKCNILNSRLATIETQAESDNIRNSNSQAGNSWIGCNRLPAGEWNCNGVPIDHKYGEWDVGEPYPNAEHGCVVRTNPGALKAYICTVTLPYICEYDIPSVSGDIESIMRSTSTVGTTTLIIDDFLINEFKHEIFDLLGRELSSFWGSAVPDNVSAESLISNDSILDNVKRLETNKYVSTIDVITDVINDYEIDCTVGEATHRVIFPAATVTKAFWMSVGILKNLSSASPEPDYKMGSRIMSVTLFDKNGQVIPYNGDQPVQITFELIDKVKQKRKLICTYFNSSTNDSIQRTWSNNGCKLHQSNNTHVTCNCTHLSTFAVLVGINSDKCADIHYEVFEYMEYVGMSLSIICLIITLIIYGICRLYKRPRIIIHTNLAASLLIANLIYLTGKDANAESACKAVSVLLHYFFLVVYMWMLFEGIHLYLKISPTVKLTMQLPVCMVIAWGIPMLIAAITLAIRHNLYAAGDAKDLRCFLPDNKEVFLAFYIPICCIILVNCFILFTTIRIFLSLKSNKDKSEVERIRAGLRAILMLSPILGVTSLFGFLDSIPPKPVALVFSYLFHILHPLQGVFIFITQCLMDEEVKKFFKQRSGRVENAEQRQPSKSTSASHVT